MALNGDKDNYSNLNGTKIGVVIGVPSRGNIRLEWAAMLKSLGEPVNYSWALQTTLGKPVDEGRNMVARYAVEHNANYLFFIDDDVLVPNQALRRMVYSMEQNPEWDLLSGIYVTKSDPPEPLIFGENPDGAFWDWKFNEIFPISGCGMGCCLIRGSALQKVKEPWFYYRHEAEGINRLEEGEDLYFCRKLREAGGVLMADGGVLCGHIDENGKVYSLDSESLPIKRADPEELERFVALRGKA